MSADKIEPMHFFSYGGGVQSSAIALMLIHQPQRFARLPDHIIFADPGAESPQTYRHIKSMYKMLRSAGFECHIIKPKQAIQHSARGIASVLGSEKGILRRYCTSDYKIQPINRFIREKLGYKKGDRIPVGSAITWLGISTDESVRAVPSRDRWIENFYPLIQMGIDRNECQLLNYHYLDYLVPKSSCYFCPFTKRSEWERRKKEDPKAFDRAVKLDEQLRVSPPKGAIDKCYVHGSAYPLSYAVNDQLTLDLGFEKECGGHCGI
jgi:hypothetical protein